MPGKSTELTSRAPAVVAELAAAVERASTVQLSSLPADQTGLVIIDMVDGFARQGALSSPRVAALIPTVARIHRYFQEHGMPVVALADTHPTDAAEFEAFPPHCIVGTQESEMVTELKAIGGYTLVPKNSTNGFLEPAFREWLDRHGSLRTFVVLGDCTDICILQFALALKADANRRNLPLRVIVPATAVDTFDAPGHHGEFMHLVGLTIMAGAGIEIVRDLV